MFPQKITLKNNKELIIHEAEKDDAAAVIEYVKQVIGESDFLTRGPGEFNKDVQEEEMVILKHKESSNKLFIIGLIDGQIVSVLNFDSSSKKRMRHVGEFGITVKKEFWGQGIGNLMLGALVDWAKSTKIIRKINLTVQTKNEPAINLYKKYGFQIEGTVTRHALINGIFYDSYIMGLLID